MPIFNFVQVGQSKCSGAGYISADLFETNLVTSALTSTSRKCKAKIGDTKAQNKSQIDR